MNLFSMLLYLLFCCLSGNAQSTNWYKVFTGKMGNMDAVLHLSKSKNFSGYIWFKQNQWPVLLYSDANDSIKNDSIYLGGGNGPMSFSFSGVLKGEDFNGKGTLEKENSGKKSFIFHLQEDKNFTPFDYFYAEGHAKLPPPLKNESTYKYYSGTVWPQGKSALDEALKKNIREQLGIKTNVANPAGWLKENMNKNRSSWEKENNKLSPKEASEMGMSLSVEEENRVMVMYENDHSITLANFIYSYTGGAHGNYGTSLTTFSKKTGKKTELSDVLTPQGIKSLPALLDRVARLQYGIKNNKPLKENFFFEDKIMPSKNYYLTSTGIGFLYAPYEIKSFADGEINFLVPFTALNAWLKPEFRK